MLTQPLVLVWGLTPTFTITRLGTVCPATKFKLEARGWLLPIGYTVRKLGAVAPVAVTFRITAETPVAGMPLAARPATWTLMVCPGPTAVLVPPFPVRVSRMRAGTTGV